ncbi:hypothetical protein PENTCL1PPCAC_11934, partial [Pristionchus entomophagus]
LATLFYSLSTSIGLQTTRLFSNVMDLSIIVLILLSIDNSMATVSSTSSALVLYSTDTAPLARFRETTRRVTVGVDRQTTVILEQSWDEYGVAGVLWDSATVLVDFLLKPESAVDLNGKSILELGAGLGLPSIALSLLSSPSRIIATEQSLGLPLLQRNVQANMAAVKTVELDWSTPSSSSVSSSHFDVILGADLVYKEEAFEPLIRTIETLATPDTVIYFASRIRYPKVFANQYSRLKFSDRTGSSTVISLRVVSELTDCSTIRIRTFTCTRCNGNDC